MTRRYLIILLILFALAAPALGCSCLILADPPDSCWVGND